MTRKAADVIVSALGRACALSRYRSASILEKMITISIFGASGDLAGRLLYPALYRLESAGRLDDVRLVGVALEDWSSEDFAAHVSAKVGEAKSIDPDVLTRLVGRFSYLTSDLSPESLASMGGFMADVNVYYLALPPGLFAKAASAIATSGITEVGTHRLVVEKPFGTDRSTASALNSELHQHWNESQIFRIDHFLGKETVQNLSVTRFANRAIEPLLCATHIDQVQITVAETLGVEGRYRYYDGIGALRDMLQNHLMQLFCLAAMEPPPLWDAELLRDHKTEVLRSVRPPVGGADSWAARGQYGAGSIGGQTVDAYRDEPGIKPASTTETFAALALHVDNWRWQGVPFYLRSGKRMGAKVSEIAYRFREPPTQLFHHTALASADPNWLVFRLDEPEGVDLFLQTKTPGLEMAAELSHLHADYGTSEENTTAYEQLLLDVIEGDHTPFLRFDEVDEAWRIVDPVLSAWQREEPSVYPSGSAGPESQNGVLDAVHQWRPLPVLPDGSASTSPRSGRGKGH